MSSTDGTNEASGGVEFANASTGDRDNGHNTSRHLADNGEARPTLEGLPSELRSEILSNVRDLRTLKSLVRASPTFHEQYRLNRDRLLKNCLESDLDGFYVDAAATLKSRAHHLGRDRFYWTITAFLDSYKYRVVRAFDFDSAEDVTSIDSSDVYWLCAFHLSVALPLADLLCQWALANLERLAASSINEAVRQEPEAAAKVTTLSMLTKSERIRILRALYRCETYHHLFGQNDGKRIGTQGFRHSTIARKFFNIFQPWEAEEVGCVDFFIRRKYMDVFNKVKVDLNPGNSRFDDQRRGGDPNGSHELDKYWDEYMEGTISLGPTITAQILAINNCDQLLDKMASCLTTCQSPDASIQKSLSMSAQYNRQVARDNIPDAMDAAEVFRPRPFPFSGDTVPPRGPPLAWVLLWKGKYVNKYGEYVPETLKASGWIVWDKRRLDSMGASKPIADQWKKEPDLVEEIARDSPWLGGLVRIGTDALLETRT